jgi:hypothetical protein
MKQTKTSTLDAVSPIIARIYGTDETAAALALQLVERIDAWEPRFPNETRENMIRETCWMWFSGGSTAAIAARDIEAALAS